VGDEDHGVALIGRINDSFAFENDAIPVGRFQSGFFIRAMALVRFYGITC
jgi:hypothetical protein